MAYDAQFRDKHRLTFGAVAQQYERARPTFPAEAVRWALRGEVRDVVDVGAGTGKLTRVLLEQGYAVTAVEPDDAMREVLADELPEVPLHAGQGEQIPLPDHTADAVTFGQAWHWVDVDLAVPEVARVLRPGGVLALLWNVEIEDVPWMAQALHVPKEIRESRSEPQVGEPFGPVESHVVEWSERISKEQFVERVTSRSFYLAMPADELAAEVEHIWTVLRTHPAVKDDESVDIEFRTLCYRAVLPG